MLAALSALAVALPAGASPTAGARFRVVSAKATATLTFHTETADLSSISNGKVTLTVTPRSQGGGTVPGRVLFPLKGTLSERVRTRRRASDTSPYQEQTCANTRKIAGRGGLTFRRSGSKTAARWAFPQARPRFCRGPGLGSITAAMRKLVATSLFQRRAVTITIAGSKKIQREGTSLTYRWRASVKLAPR